MTETIDSSTPGVLAQRFVDAFNARDEQALGKLYHPDAMEDQAADLAERG